MVTVPATTAAVCCHYLASLPCVLKGSHILLLHPCCCRVLCRSLVYPSCTSPSTGTALSACLRPPSVAHPAHERWRDSTGHNLHLFMATHTPPVSTHTYHTSQTPTTTHTGLCGLGLPLPLACYTQHGPASIRPTGFAGPLLAGSVGTQPAIRGRQLVALEALA